MLNPDAQEARARLEAHRRMTPGADLDALTREVMAEYASGAGDADGAEIDAMIWDAPRMTPAQLARIRRLARDDLAAHPAG
jgi:hypothetical protein